MRGLLTLIAVCLLLGSCSTTGCLENQSSLPIGGFYSSATETTVSIDSLQIWGVGSPGDSMLVDGVASQTYLPLRSSATSSSFCFHYAQKELSNPALNDTLTITYTSRPQFVSEECGAMYFYEITSATITTHLVDSVVIVNPVVDNFDRETLKIYFRTETPDEDLEEEL